MNSLLRSVVCVITTVLVGCSQNAVKDLLRLDGNGGPGSQNTAPVKAAVEPAKPQPSRPPDEAQAKILAELQEQNRLLRLEREAREAEKNWAAERERYLQAWASLQAKTREQLDKIQFDSDQAQSIRQSRSNNLTGKSTVPSISRWVPTYGQWYPRYLEEYRKVCGTMSKDELRNFAREQSLSWND